MRERRRAVARDTAQSVRSVCLLSVCCACPFFTDGALREVSPHWPLPARLPKGRDLGSPAIHDSTHTLPTSVRCRTRIPSHLLSPGLHGNQDRVSRWCQLLPRRPLRQKLPAEHRTDQCWKWWWLPTPSRVVFHLNRDSHDHKRNQFLPD